MFSRTSGRLVAFDTTSLRAFRPVCRSFVSQSPSTNRFRATQIPKSFNSTQVRFISFPQRLRRGYRAASKDIFRRNPIVLPFAIVSIIAASAFFTYAFYIQTRNVNPKVSRFPDPVAKELRKALYYTEVNLEPDKAVPYYKAAIRTALELKMHPFSDEVLGIQLQIVEMLVKAGLHERAVRYLRTIMKDAGQYVEKTRLRLAVGAAGTSVPIQPDMGDPNVKEIFAPSKEDWNAEYRRTTKVIKKIIGMKLLLGELYEDEHLQNPAQAFIERRGALNVFRKEMENRQLRGLPPVATREEGEDWMNAEEVSHTMSGVGETWLRAGRPEKALELLMPAVAILRSVEGKDISCRQVVLLSNIAAAMFDHKQPEQKSLNDKTAEVSIEKQMESSKDWALKAIEVSQLVEEDMRDEDCDMGCAAAADVLSAIAEWEGADEEARKWLREEKRYCESAQFEEGVRKASKALAARERQFAEQRRRS